MKGHLNSIGGLAGCWGSTGRLLGLPSAFSQDIINGKALPGWLLGPHLALHLACLLCKRNTCIKQWVHLSADWSHCSVAVKLAGGKERLGNGKGQPAWGQGWATAWLSTRTLLSLNDVRDVSWCKSPEWKLSFPCRRHKQPARWQSLEAQSVKGLT